MSQTVDIGAARVRLIVDAQDFDSIIAQGKNAVRGFGQEAQQSYDRTEKATRRAADALLDYVNSLGRADTTLDRYVRNASRLGVEKPVLDAAITAWQRHNDEVELAERAQNDQIAAVKRAQAAYKELTTVQQEQERQQRALADAAARARVEEGSAQFARNAQERFNSQLGVSEADSRASAQRRADAEAAFLPLIQQQNDALEKQRLLAETIATARAQQNAALAQQDFNELLGVQDRLVSSAQRRADAEAAFLPIIERENDALQQQKLLADAITTARQQNSAEQAQAQFNRQLGVADVDPRQAASRRADAEAAFLPLVEKENDALQRQKAVIDTIATARAQQNAALAQQDFNKLLGIDAQEDALALQRRRADAQAAFLPLIEKEAQAERDTLQRQAGADAYIKQLQNTELAAGKTYYELLRLKAAELGVSDAAGPIIAKIEAQNKAMGRGTISAKQYALAVRQLPAQFTDVFTSLVAGQNPLLVILQQGGQVKDMFGGIRAAIGAVAKEAALLAVNPYVLLAAAIATVAVAAYQADTRITALAVSAAKGNGVAGTARELSRYTEQLNKLNNINLSGADAAVSKLAEGGKLAGQNFRLAAEASARWASVTGEAVDEVAEKFTSIARDPMAAILDGTVKITEAQYEQIRALVESGEQQKAVTELVKIYYDQINKNTQSVVTNLSESAKAWREIKDAITGVWREAQNLFDYLAIASVKADKQLGDGFLSRLGSVFSGRASLEFVGGLKPKQVPPEATDGGVGSALGLKVRQDSLALTQQQIKANEALAKRWDESGSSSEKLATKIAKLNAELRQATDGALAQRGIVRNDDGTFGGAGYQRLVKALQEKDKGRQRQGPDPTKAIQERERTALAALRATQQEFDYLYADRESSIEAYYAKSIFLAREEADVQIKSNNEQIKALTGRRDSEDKIASLRQQNRTVEEEFAAKKAKLDRDELLATRQRTAAMRDYIQALADGNAQLEKNFAQQARGVGRGGRNPERLNALDNAQADFDRNIREINDQVSDNQISPEEAAKKKEEQFAALVEKQRVIQQGYADIAAAESYWLNGSTKAWEDWLLQVGDIAKQVGDITTSAITGMVDVISNKIRTGTSGFKDYLDDLNKQILDFIIKQQLTKFFKQIGAATGDTGLGTILVNLGSALFGSASAKGNVFSGGVLSAYRNQIVSQPTYFAKGGVPNVNLMGERSGKPHEAVMPLTRTAGGDLGVKMVGQQQKVTNISQTFVVPGVPDRTTRDQLAIKMLGGAQRAARRN